MPLPHQLRRRFLVRDAVIGLAFASGWLALFFLAAITAGWRFGVGVALFAAFTALSVSAFADWFTARRREFLDRTGRR